jgi:hypothetical protein
MAERNDIPSKSLVYTADDDKQINEVFTVEGMQYKFVKVASGNFVRKGDALYVNADGLATTALNAGVIVNAIAVINIDALAADKYALVAWKGSTVKVATVDDTVSCVYNGTKIVSWINGQMRCANANVFVSNSNSMIITPATSCSVGFQKTATAVFGDYVTEGDMISTNAGLKAVVVGIPNTNAIFTTASTSVLAGAHLINVTYAGGGVTKSNMSCSCANASYETVTVPTLGLFSGVNLCSSTTTLFANACVFGRIIKVGDVINGPNSSTRLITALVNSYAATINTAMNTETSGLLGSVWNANVKFITAIIN